MSTEAPVPFIAIACGGTGGHLFPGLAVAEALMRSGAEPLLLVSEKTVDRTALAAGAPGMRVESLPAVGWDAKRPWRFLRGAIRSWHRARRLFERRFPDAVLAMGGFTSLGPVSEARRLGLRIFLHESNTVPGRANRWLSRWVDAVFVDFPETALRLRARAVREVGTPVRAGLGLCSAGECRMALGLDAHRPVLLVCGGSQGAHALNRLVVEALDLFRDRLPQLQFLHLAGSADEREVAEAYRRRGVQGRVYGFLDRMGEALGASDMAVSRAGASTLAEFAAVRLPALLVPYPTAADDHQAANARAFSERGAARWCVQAELTAETLVGQVEAVLNDRKVLASMREALGRRHRPRAAAEIAQGILEFVAEDREQRGVGSRVAGRAAERRLSEPGGVYRSRYALSGGNEGGTS